MASLHLLFHFLSFQLDFNLSNSLYLFSCSGNTVPRQSIMTSFGKLSAAFQQVSAEATLAFASFNFDFALIKYEAPEEYKGLGDSLSQRRKDAAEDGSSHITARKLNALFRTIIPEVPHLTQAYGQRATEIAKSPHINPRDTSTASVFADHIGADSTTIWAAATSGNGAVTIHLLACMLARIWTRKHAVSIWTELIEQRKEVLRGKLEGNGDPFHISDIAASRIEITTSQLDDWDASARLVVLLIPPFHLWFSHCLRTIYPQ